MRHYTRTTHAKTAHRFSSTAPVSEVKWMWVVCAQFTLLSFHSFSLYLSFSPEYHSCLVFFSSCSFHSRPKECSPLNYVVTYVYYYYFCMQYFSPIETLEKFNLESYTRWGQSIILTFFIYKIAAFYSTKTWLHHFWVAWPVTIYVCGFTSFPTTWPKKCNGCSVLMLSLWVPLCRWSLVKMLCFQPGLSIKPARGCCCQHACN